jgi:ribose transport system permease protein
LLILECLKMGEKRNAAGSSDNLKENLVKGHQDDFKLKLNKYFPQILLCGVLLALVIFMSCASEYFLQWRNFKNILDQCAVYIVLSVGMTFVIGTGGVDLSVGYLAGFAGVIAAIVMQAGFDYRLAILLGLATGVLMGFINGFFVAKVKINPFITTLATMSVSQGIALLLTGGVAIYGFEQGFKNIGTGQFGPITTPTVISLVFVAVGAVLLSKTLWGKYCLSLGGNGEALRRTGVSVNAYRISVYVLSGFCAAVAGIIMAARLNSAAPIAGAGYEMDAIAAVVLGGGSMNGGTGSMFGTFVACITLGIIRNGLTLLSIPTYYQYIITGSIILIAIVISEVRKRKEIAA